MYSYMKKSNSSAKESFFSSISEKGTEEKPFSVEGFEKKSLF